MTDVTHVRNTLMQTKDALIPLHLIANPTNRQLFEIAKLELKVRALTQILVNNLLKINKRRVL